MRFAAVLANHAGLVRFQVLVQLRQVIHFIVKLGKRIIANRLDFQLNDVMKFDSRIDLTLTSIARVMNHWVKSKPGMRAPVSDSGRWADDNNKAYKKRNTNEFDSTVSILVPATGQSQDSSRLSQACVFFSLTSHSTRGPNQPSLSGLILTSISIPGRKSAGRSANSRESWISVAYPKSADRRSNRSMAATCP